MTGFIRTAGFLVLATLALSGCNGSEETTEAASPRPVLTAVAELKPARTEEYAGTVEPQVKTDIGFRIIGRLISRDVDVGDTVARGERLAAIDPTALELAVRSASAEVGSALAQLTNAQAAAERQRALLTTQASTQSTVESADQAAIAAEATVSRAQAALAKAEEQLSYAQVEATFDAVVTATAAEVGQIVEPGDAVVTIARPDLRDAVVDIPVERGPIAIGTKFRISLQMDPNAVVAGSVREVAPEADAITRTLRVRIALIDPPASFRLGTTVRAALEHDSTPALTLPVTALLEQDGKTYVWLIDEKDSIAVKQEIEVAHREDGIFTVASGLQPGSRVAIAGVHTLQDRQKIIVPEGNAP
ncbi:efflux RND transporter periplasmic adaptor subunit [Rhizobium cremeum]|uniref:efflux RND transporter periplasmic adaptor subunit n=1 Tax=Rhizobium cremeum TaxID=2813827 RepID=UPI000DE07231|nr:efflux RND transporter periplasmic adaptor subunit [Rhizobium cremeum]MCJ7996479.1 efflux RND transporter periplasmic adaptor subunit [Rhizobium cremeum]MCJ8001738.1 efflux RND transporter periplasmic adaptor subunit [Rhizobium cremeum]